MLGGWVGTVGSCMRARSAAALTHRLVDIELAAHGWLFAACLDCVCYTRNPPSKPAASRAASRPASALVLALCEISSLGCFAARGCLHVAKILVPKCTS